MTKDDANLEISIFVPNDDIMPLAQDNDRSTEDHALKWPSRSSVERVNAKVMDQWEGTISRLMQMSNVIRSKAEDWTVDEIEVGFTLSAEGELLFIAKAGAQASITVKLKRKSLSE